MMKFSGLVVGLAALLAAGSANATVVYDTITGQIENNSVRDSLRPVSAANRGPLGDSFIASGSSTLTNVTLRLRNVNTTATGDTGAILVYIVPDVGGIPSSSGLTLTGATLLGTILDTAVAFGGTTVPSPSAFANISLTTSAALTGGTKYWIEVVDAADPNNGNRNTVPTFLKWGLNSDVSGVGVPSAGANIVSFSNGANTGLTAFNATNDTFVTPTGGEVFEMSLTTTPEPATLAILGAGLLGLGFSRRRKAKSQA